MSPGEHGNAAAAAVVACWVIYVAFRVEYGDDLGVCGLTACAEIGVDSYDSGCELRWHDKAKECDHTPRQPFDLGPEPGRRLHVLRQGSPSEPSRGGA